MIFDLARIIFGDSEEIELAIHAYQTNAISEEAFLEMLYSI